MHASVGMVSSETYPQCGHVSCEVSCKGLLSTELHISGALKVAGCCSD